MLLIETRTFSETRLIVRPCWDLKTNQGALIRLLLFNVFWVWDKQGSFGNQKVASVESLVLGVGAGQPANTEMHVTWVLHLLDLEKLKNRE